MTIEQYDNRAIKHQGQILIEVLIAIGIVAIVALIIALALQTGPKTTEVASQQARAYELAAEAQEIVRDIANCSWLEVCDNSLGIYSNCLIASGSNYYPVPGEEGGQGVDQSGYAYVVAWSSLAPLSSNEDKGILTRVRLSDMSVVNSTGWRLELDDPRNIVISRDGKYAYVVAYDFDALVRVDISDPAVDPFIVNYVRRYDVGDPDGALNGLESLVLSSDGQYAYVSSHHEDRLVRIDISNPAQAPIVKNYTSDSDRTYLDGLEDVVLTSDGRHAFVAARNARRLVRVDISDPDSAPFVDGYTPSSCDFIGIESVALSPDEKYAYINSLDDLESPNPCDNDPKDEDPSAFVRIDISDPGGDFTLKNQKKVTGADPDMDIMKGPRGVVLSSDGNYAYVTARTRDRLVRFDISNPEQAPTIDAYTSDADRPTLDGIHALQLSPDENYAYVTATNANRFVKIDISGAGTGEGAIFVESSAQDSTLLAESEGFALGYPLPSSFCGWTLASGSEQVNLGDTLYSRSVKIDNVCRDESGGITQGGGPSGLRRYAYVTAIGEGDTGSFVVIDVTDSRGPFYLTSLSRSELFGARSVALSGDHAFVVAGLGGEGSNDGRVVSINISDPANPSYKHGLSNAEFYGSADIAVSGNYAYVVGTQQDSVSSLDIGVPSNMVLENSLPRTEELDRAYGLDISGDYAYIVSIIADSITSVDISPQPSLSFVDSYSSTPRLDGAQDIAISGDYAFVAAFNVDALTAFKINDTFPGEVTYVDHLSRIELDGASSVAVSGNYAFVVSRTTLSVIDITTPSDLIFVKSIPLPGFNSSYIEIYGNYAYVTGRAGLPDFDSLFSVVDISNPVNPVVDKTLTLPAFSGFARLAIEEREISGEPTCEDDPSTRKVTVTVDGPIIDPIRLISYITRWGRKDAGQPHAQNCASFQADWSGGLTTTELLSGLFPCVSAFNFGNLFNTAWYQLTTSTDPFVTSTEGMEFEKLPGSLFIEPKP